MHRFRLAGHSDVKQQLDAALNLDDMQEYVSAFEQRVASRVSAAPPSSACAPAAASPLCAPAREPAPVLATAPHPVDALLSRLTACVDSFCGGELTLPQPEMKLALCCPSCSANLRAVDDAALKQMRARPAPDAEEPKVFMLSACAF